MNWGLGETDTNIQIITSAFMIPQNILPTLNDIPHSNIHEETHFSAKEERQLVPAQEINFL